MKLEISSMRIENFKGCPLAEIDFDGDRTLICGANGTGKTTIADAFCWVLFNQNAAGSVPGSDNFREKPLDGNGNTVHNLDTSVELAMTIEGQRFDVKRTQSENWVKKRGTANAVYQGNVSRYWINGVEVKVTEFRQRIAEIVDGEIFRLIGSLGAFNAMDWKKRRAHLKALSNVDADGQLLAMPEYSPIKAEIERRNISVDDLRRVLADQRKAVNKELQTLPVRIDEATKSIPQLGDREVRDAEYIVADTRKGIEKIDERILASKAESGEAARMQAILSLEQAIMNAKREAREAHDSERRRVLRAADEAHVEMLNVQKALQQARNELEITKRRMERWTARRDELRDEFLKVKREQFAPDAMCPVCGQEMPEAMLAEAREKAEQAKREKLKKIQSEGKDYTAQIDADAEYAQGMAAQVTELEARAEEAQERAAEAREVANVFPSTCEIDETAEPFAGLNRQLAEARAQQVSGDAAIVDQLVERKREMQAILDRNVGVLQRKAIADETRARVDSYTKRQKELGDQLSEIEVLIDLVERFVRARCGALEDGINACFPSIRWKLFDEQINGGMVDTCVAMLDCGGKYVPYESANTARQIAADMEIVDVLSRHYNVRVPLFVDNAERVNTLPEIDSQTIILMVTNDKQLRIA